MQAFFSPCSAKTDTKPSQRPIDGYVAVLGTGGTIAGQASGGAVNEHLDYKSGEVGIDALIGDLAHRVLVVHGDIVSVGVGVQCEQVAQIDSKNASWDFLWLLAAATAKALAKPQCMGVVVTHGTDTLEETAWFLSCVLGDKLADKPVVLTCAMRPANALSPDGPQNMVDAITVAAYGGASGVQVCVAGACWSGQSVQKVHPYRLNAFDGADTGPVAYVEGGRVRPVVVSAPSRGDCPVLGYAAARTALDSVVAGGSVPVQAWVELVVHTAASNVAVFDALKQVGVQGVVVMTTGNGTVNDQWLAALQAHSTAGWPVWCASRCQSGFVVAGRSTAGVETSPAQWQTTDGLPVVLGLSGVKTRISMLLWLLDRTDS